MMKKSIKTYSELITLATYKERFEYLSLNGIVGVETFGYDRYLNQALYNSYDWKKLRREIIIRDNGCDLGCEGYEIEGRALIHHINPITMDDILHRRQNIFDPENLITTVHNTHNAIHYGTAEMLSLGPIERTPNDTCLWK